MTISLILLNELVLGTSVSQIFLEMNKGTVVIDFINQRRANSDSAVTTTIMSVQAAQADSPLTNISDTDYVPDKESSDSEKTGQKRKRPDETVMKALDDLEAVLSSLRTAKVSVRKIQGFKCDAKKLTDEVDALIKLLDNTAVRTFPFH